MTETQKPKPLDMRAVSSVSFGDLLRTISPEIASQIALRKCSEEMREESGYIGMFATKIR